MIKCIKSYRNMLKDLENITTKEVRKYSRSKKSFLLFIENYFLNRDFSRSDFTKTIAFLKQESVHIKDNIFSRRVLRIHLKLVKILDILATVIALEDKLLDLSFDMRQVHSQNILLEDAIVQDYVNNLNDFIKSGYYGTRKNNFIKK